ncbi:hypothetical protein [Jeotgalibacillus malaysiensis]|uniref:hypothetical protein n=1 Tax=Jeotgalibacillus malaysiensis TaxID=1508404 RepID=UPI003850A931
MGYKRNIMKSFFEGEIEEQKVTMEIKKSFYSDVDNTVTFSLDSKDYFKNDLIEEWINKFIDEGFAEEEILKERLAKSPLSQYATLIF